MLGREQNANFNLISCAEHGRVCHVRADGVHVDPRACCCETSPRFCTVHPAGADPAAVASPWRPAVLIAQVVAAAAAPADPVQLSMFGGGL